MSPVSVASIQDSQALNSFLMLSGIVPEKLLYSLNYFHTEKVRTSGHLPSGFPLPLVPNRGLPTSACDCGTSEVKLVYSELWL